MNSVDGLKNQERAGKTYMFVAMVIAGTIGYFVILSGQKPFNIIFFRSAIGGLGLILYCWYKGYFKSLEVRPCELILMAMGSITLIANWYFLVTAYSLTSVGIATVIYNVQPFLLVLFGLVFQKQKPSLSEIVWLTTAFCGVAILAQPTIHDASSYYLLGVGSALVAAMLYAATTLLTKSLAATMRPEVIAVSHMIFGTVVVLPLTNFHSLPDSNEHILAVVILGLFHTTFMYVLLYSAYQKAVTISIAVLGFVYPLVAVAIDFFAFGKTMNLAQCMGGALILLAATAYAVKFNVMTVAEALRFNRWTRKS